MVPQEHTDTVGTPGLWAMVSALLAALVALPAILWAQPPATPVVIRPGLAPEAEYLVAQHSALREIGYDPLCPYTRVADGQTMYYEYRFRPGKGQMSYILAKVGSQFLISVSTDEGDSYEPLADFRHCERVGTYVLLDLTPALRDADGVRLRFEDKQKEDGWGALLSELVYYEEGAGPSTRIDLAGPWQINGAPYSPGKTAPAGTECVASTAFELPVDWEGKGLGLYFAGFHGRAVDARLNGQWIDLQGTWDGGRWADVSSSAEPGTQNRLEVKLQPVDGKVGLCAPVRIGLSRPACAVPIEKTCGGYRLRPKRLYAPYAPAAMNALAGNFMQCLYDRRYDLLTFSPGERMPIHFVHDTLRSLLALADEERYTPVVRLELVQRLYQGCKRALLPGGEYLFAFKHDERPVDIRPLGDSGDLTLTHKLDLTRKVAAVGLRFKGQGGTWSPPAAHADTPVERTDKGWTFTREWTSPERSITARALYAPGDADTPPVLEFALDGGGPVRVGLEQLALKDMWFIPGCWGPEAIVLPTGKELWAHETELDVANPGYRYVFIRGGNSGQFTFCRALLVMWDRPPDRLVAVKAPGGRHGKLFDQLALEYDNAAPADVRITLMPFDGYPRELKTPRAIAQSILRAGKLGAGIYDPVASASSNGLGPGGMAAAAYLLRKYNAPEAEEAEELALQCMQAFVALDRAGTTTQQLYHLLNGCEYLHLMGHTEYDQWARTWADRILQMQAEDGSWAWLNFQLRNMIALLRAHNLLGDHRYRQAFDRALATLDCRTDGLYWQGKLDRHDDFAGAGPFAIYGHIGDVGAAQQILRLRAAYVDDQGFFGCSDLNPYMLGFSAKGLGIVREPKLVLGLTEFAQYGAGGVRRVARPTAYVVNPYHPMSLSVGPPMDYAGEPG